MPERDYSHRPLTDKLGVKPGSRTTLKGDFDPNFRSELVGVGAEIGETPPFDLIILRVDSYPELDQLLELKKQITPSGAIWVITQKGSERAISETELIRTGKTAGLIDNKVASFSDSLTALRFVIPLKDRP